MASWMAPYRFDEDPLCWPADGMCPDAALFRPFDGEPAFDGACTCADQSHPQTAGSDPSPDVSEVQRLGSMTLDSPRKPGTRKQRLVEAITSIKATLRRGKREQQPEPSPTLLQHPSAAPGDRFVHGCCEDPFVPPAPAVHRRIRSEHADPWANMPPWPDSAWLWAIDDPLMLPANYYHPPAGLIMPSLAPHGMPLPTVAPPAAPQDQPTHVPQVPQAHSLRPRPPRAPSSGTRHRRVRDASPSSPLRRPRGTSSSPQPRRHASAGSISSVRSAAETPRGVRKRRSRDAGVAAVAGDEMGFVNFTPSDGEALMTGVAPSGSSKTKARREKEALERRRRLSEAAIKAVVAAGGDVDRLIQEGFEWRLND